GTPPLYLDLLENIVRELKRFPPKLTASEITEWEERFKGRFGRIYAVVETVRVIPATYEEFDWSNIIGAGFRIVSIYDAHKKQERRSFEEFIKKLEKEDWVKSDKMNVEDLCELRFADEKSGYPDRFKQLREDQPVWALTAGAARSARLQSSEAKIRA